MTREMVLTEQPLNRAMSLMVRFGIPGDPSLFVENGFSLKLYGNDVGNGFSDYSMAHFVE